MGKNNLNDICKKAGSAAKNSAHNAANNASNSLNKKRRKRRIGSKDEDTPDFDMCATDNCTPIIKDNNVYVPLPAPKCSDAQYSSIVNNPSSFALLIDASNNTIIDEYRTMFTQYYPLNPSGINLDFLYDCIQGSKYNSTLLDLQNQKDGIDTKVSTYSSQKGVIDTYNEMNNSSLYYYKTDLTYIICKISLFIILIITYIYFFKLTGIIEPFKKLFNMAATKGDSIINKITDKIKKPTNAIPKPTNANPKPTNAIPKPTNAIPKPTNAIPKPTNGNPKPTNAIPKQALLKPTTSNSKPKIKNLNPKSSISK